MMPVPGVSMIRMRDLLADGEQCHYAEAQLSGTGIVPAHAHDFVEMFWIPAGQGVESTPARDWPLVAGDVVFVPADQVHGFAPTGGQSLTIRNLALPRRAWAALRLRYADGLADRFAAAPAGRRCHVPHLLGLVEEAAAELIAGRRTRLATDRFLLRVDHVLASHARTIAIGPAWLTEAVQWLHAPATDLTDATADFVERCGRSAEHVARCCRLYLGRSPTELIDEARVRRAARLLATTDAAVLDICFDSGFNNVGHFHARFRHGFGQTPRRYRVRCRGTMRMDAPGASLVPSRGTPGQD